MSIPIDFWGEKIMQSLNFREMPHCFRNKPIFILLLYRDAITHSSGIGENWIMIGSFLVQESLVE